MAWLIPSIITTFFGSLILVWIYFYMYWEQKTKSMLAWAVSWSVYSTRYIFMLLFIRYPETQLFLFGNQFASLLSGVLLFWGSCLYTKRKIHPVFSIFFMVFFLWLILSISMNFSFFLVSLPVFIFLGVINIYTGFLFIYAKSESERERKITGVSFIVWGLHKMDYPFLRPILWLAPWGYLLSTLLTFSTAMGLILISYKRILRAYDDKTLLLKTIIETMPDLIWLKDTEGKYLFCNSRCARYIGRDGKEIIGRSNYDFLPESHADEYRERDRSVIMTNKRICYQETVRYPDDNHKEILDTILTPAMDSKGQLIGVMGVARDVSLQKQREKDINRLTECTVGHVGQELYDSIAKITCEWLDCDCTIIGRMTEPMKISALSCYMDNQYIKNYSYDLKGTPCDNVRIKGPCLYPDDITVLFPEDGELLSMNARGYIGTPILDSHENFQGIFCTVSRSRIEFSDETMNFMRIIATRLGTEMEREKAENALMESEKRFELAMEASKDGLYDINLSTGDTYFSSNFKSMIGYERDELADQMDAIKSLFEPEDLKRLSHFYMDLRNSRKERFEFEIRIKHKKGHWVNVVSRGLVLYNDAQEPVRIIGTHSDLTRIKRVESQLKQSQKMETIGTMAGGIAHDFNNILTPIIGYSELLMRIETLDDSIKSRINSIYKSANRGQDLVSKILSFSRQNDEKPSAIELHPAVREGLDLISAVIPKSIEIKLEIQDTLGYVIADTTLIHQILMNLSTNAWHAMEGTTHPVLTVGLRSIKLDDLEASMVSRSFQAGEYALLSVQDTGCGMEDAIIEKVFDPFFTTKDKGKGTGMGLSIIHSLVHSIGGEITLKSQIGAGTIFEIYLPLLKETFNTSVKIAAKKGQNSTAHILFIDDEEFIGELGKEILENAGYSVNLFSDGMAAVDAFRESPDSFDLVITDKAMPKMTGDQLALEIKALKPEVPILLCTGYSDQINDENAESLGFKGLIQKPIKMEHFLNAVREALEQ